MRTPSCWLPPNIFEGKTDMKKLQANKDLVAKDLWRHRGQARPAFAVLPGKGQESV